MHIEGPKWQAPAPPPVPKKPKTGGLIDAIKKAAELGVAAKRVGAAVQKVASDADQTEKVKAPTATSKLSLKEVGGTAGAGIQAGEGPQTTQIAYRVRNSSSGNGELI